MKNISESLLIQHETPHNENKMTVYKTKCILRDLFDKVVVYKGEKRLSLLKEATNPNCPLDRTLQRDIDPNSPLQIQPWRLNSYIKFLHPFVRTSEIGQLIKTAMEEGCITESQGQEKLRNLSHSKSNLPSFKRFLSGSFRGRSSEITRAFWWLSQDTILWLWGPGGYGKTVLQLFLAEHFLWGGPTYHRNYHFQPFDAAVWISGAEQTITFRSFLNTTASTLDKKLNGWGQASETQVGEMLCKNRVLLLFDNSEEIDPGEQVSIIRFFRQLRTESQMIFNSRYYPINLNGITTIEIKGLKTVEAQEFLTDHCKQLEIDSLPESERCELLRLTKNNPKAIQIILGILKRGISFNTILTAIQEGNPDTHTEEIYTCLINFAIAKILDVNEIKLLLAKSLFRSSERDNVIVSIAGIDGKEADSALKRLSDLSLISRRVKKGKQFVETHPIVQGFLTCWYAGAQYDHFSDLPIEVYRNEIEENWKKYVREIKSRISKLTFEKVKEKPGWIEKVGNVVYRFFQLIQKGDFNALREFIDNDGGVGYAFLHWAKSEEILRICEIGILLALEQNAPRILGTLLLEMEFKIYRERGDYETNAANCISRARESLYSLRIKEVEKNDLIWLEASIDMAEGNLQRRLCKFEASLGAYQEAYNKWERVGDIQKQIDTLINKAGCLLEMRMCTWKKSHGEVLISDDWDSIQITFAEPLEILEEVKVKMHQLSGSQTCNYWKNETHAAQLAWAGVINRVGHRLQEARSLFNQAERLFKGKLSLARLYREQAIVEWMLGNRKLAHSLNKKGKRLMKQAGVLGSQEFTGQNFHQVIELLEKKETW